MPEQMTPDDELAKLLWRALKLQGVCPEMTAGDVATMFPRSGLYLYKKEEYVIQQGEESKDLYAVQSGRIAITQTMGTAGAQLAVLGPEDIFGEIALVRDGVRVASAIAAEDCRVFRVVYPDIQALMQANPKLGEHMSDLARERTGG